MKIQLFLIIAILFASCSPKNEQVPIKILHFSEKAIEASINTYPPKVFYEAYFDHSVSQEYIDELCKNAIVWRGKEHNTTLREANFIYKAEKNAEYLLKYWVKFNDKRKFSYLLHVNEKDGKMTLMRFEPLNVNIVNSVYIPESKLDVPNYASNRIKIYFTYTLIFATLLIIIILAVWKKKYLPLLCIPLLFIYKQGMTIYNYKSIDVLQPKIYFGLPLFEHIDLYFTHLSITTTGVFYAWAIVGLFIFGKFLIKTLNSKQTIKS